MGSIPLVCSDNLHKTSIIAVSIYDLEVWNLLAIWEWISECSQVSELEKPVWSLTHFHVVGFVNHMTAIFTICPGYYKSQNTFQPSSFFVFSYHHSVLSGLFMDLLFSRMLWKITIWISFTTITLKTIYVFFLLGLCISFVSICYIMQKNTIDFFIHSNFS